MSTNVLISIFSFFHVSNQWAKILTMFYKVLFHQAFHYFPGQIAKRINLKLKNISY